MTFVLVAVVYAVAIGKPSFVETGPIAVGFSLWASAIIGENCKPPLMHTSHCKDLSTMQRSIRCS